MADAYQLLERLNGILPPEAVRVLREIMDISTGHDHDGTDSAGASLTGAGITASAAELNLLDGSLAGTAVASKALALGATKNIDTLLVDVAAPDAAGNSQGTATAMTADTNLATAADGTKGVKLPTAVAGRRVIVKNTVENQILKVYPATGAAINAIAADTAIELPAGCVAVFVASSATQWYTTAIPDGITSTAAELNKLDGAGANVTAANLDGLTGGSDVARAAGGHGHLLAAGASDVTAAVAEVNAVCDGQNQAAGAGGVTAKRFVDTGLEDADVDDLAVVGVAATTAGAAATFALQASGVHPVIADAPLTAADPVKVGTGGRATKHTTAQTTIQAAIAGEATAFTQPVGATTLEILQAADVEADRGRGIVVIGSNAGGTAIQETILLDGTNTTTPVAGATSFTKVSGVYTANGAALGAQNVTVRASGAGATVCTLANATSELGADIPSGTQEAYCNEATITGPNADATFVTLVGVQSSDDAVALERAQLNGASPSVITTTIVWRQVNRICLGEMTNAGAGNVKTNATTDTAAMKCGAVVVAAAARGNDAQVLVKPTV